mmetsp:Transcript_19663/g.44954  ORF Transcript_19663/g.44954 Transcript_19663/m.44954 type:complete len:329 (-) Transcript_19663:1193-2179(-)
MKEYRNKHTINVCKGASNQSENQEKSCRICFEAESDSSNALVSPCNCKGTQRYVHTNCLKRWQRTALSQPNSKRAVICSVCNSIYSMPPPSTIYSFDDSSFAGGSLPSWLSTLSRNIFVASIIATLLQNTRNVPSLFHLMTLLIAFAFASRISFLGIADGDPIESLQAGKLLVANGIPAGSLFYRSVVLLLEHGPRGSLGVIINNNQDLGGPVQTFHPILLSDFQQGSDCNEVSGINGLFWKRLSSSNDVVELARSGVETRQLRVFRGISGWAPRQLDGEIRRGGWKIADVRLDQIFDANSRNSLWEALDSSPDTMGLAQILSTELNH